MDLDGQRRAACAAAKQTAAVAGLPQGGYEPRYVPATMPAEAVPGMLATGIEQKSGFG